jgi:7-carboxy-7-deazaguanine synthase
MSYAVKEIYYTLQGEGANAGRPAVFCRFSGCNLWNGREVDRSRAICRFCDTDFVGTDGSGGGWFVSAQALAEAVARTWGGKQAAGRPKFVVCTGGEPLLQLDDEAVRELHDAGFVVALETNGTLEPPAGLDWICVSPKARAELVVREGDELKLVYPQAGIEPEEFEHLSFEHFFLQPLDGPDLERNTELAVRYCLKRPQWQLGVQTHKLIGLREPGVRTTVRDDRLTVR